MKQPFNAESAKNSLYAYIEILLNPKTPEEIKKKSGFFAYIRRLLNQYKLYSTDIEEVINESVIRATKYVEKNSQEIQSYEGLMKRISLRVIQEMRRKQKPTLDYDSINSQVSSEDSNKNLDTLFGLEVLEALWQQLPMIDRQLIGLRIFESLSWGGVAQKLQETEQENFTEESLRKRYQRALKRLGQSLK